MRAALPGAVLHGLYGLLLELAVWTLLVPATLLAAAAGRGAPGALGQRLARAPLPPRRQGVRVLLHAVSAGEMAAARPLLAELAAALPGVQVLLSTGNPAGRAVAEQAAATLPGVVSLGLLPWDRARGLRRWLERLAPDLVVVVETELWPNLFSACGALGIPLAVVEGRIGPVALAGYRLVRPLMHRTLEHAALIGVRDAGERARFVAIGADPGRVRVLGDGKFDAAARAVQPRPPPVDAPFLLGVSTHFPEERWLLDAYRAVRARWPGLRLVLAPRRPRRAGALLRAARARGLRAAAWHARPADTAWELMVLDGFGLLAPWFAHAESVFVGGSLVDRGGHNPLEPAAWGRPVLMGPFRAHCRGAADALERAGALLPLAGPGGLADALDRLLGDAPLRERMGRAGVRTVAAGTGAARRGAGALARLLEAGP